jgi:DNA-directed RNA polymerase subunit omega
LLIYPSIDRLLEKIDSKYSLVTIASKRAHDFEERDGKKNRPLLDEYKSISNVGKALEEIVSGDLVLDPDSIDRSVL